MGQGDFGTELQDCIARIKAGLSNNERAYCCLLYGSNPSAAIVANALSMSHSLKKSRFPLVLLLTADVPVCVRTLLVTSGGFSRISVVEYIHGDVALFKKDWFRDVFTKLHAFNLVEFGRVIFLDLDIIVNDVLKMDELFELDCLFGAMENSKGSRASCNWLQHGESMAVDKCGLFNAGVIIITPDARLFELLVSDVTSPSPLHVPGMTPEQYYLARVMGNHFHHISQLYNLEVQYHGGVPVTSIWKSAATDEVVAFHFSGGSPLHQLWSKDYANFGCQTQKYYTKQMWENEFTGEIRALVSERAKLAFAKWALHFAAAARECVVVNQESWIVKLIQCGADGGDLCRASSTLVGSEWDSESVVVACSNDAVISVNRTSLEIRFHLPGPRPKRPPPVFQ